VVKILFFGVEMSKNPLQIVATEGVKGKVSRKEEAAVKFEKMWQHDPEQFNPLRNIVELERLRRTQELLHKHFDLTEKKVVDLGCGRGELTQRLSEKAAKVDAVDIASSALKQVVANSKKNVSPIQDFVPQTKLKDEDYDLVLSTELIAYLPTDLYRLYFSELSRLVKPEGRVLCSTALDIDSEDALGRFVSLAETEFKITDLVFSFHALYIRLEAFFKAPSLFIKASKDSEYRLEQINNRQGLKQRWFRWNSKPFVSYFWIPIHFLFRPFIYFLNKRKVLLWIETLCRFIWQERGISHVIFIGQRRTLVIPQVEEQVIVERKQRKQVWE
jgi:2-polyprenyl-3-methyl-5-hydroxy-6-metoxy-1,4-benzoquinol methylase